jgi:hypothetical protein
MKESEWKEDDTTTIIRGTLSRFSKFPEKGTASLASIGGDSITATSLARQQGRLVFPVTIIKSANVHELMGKIHAGHVEEPSGTDSTPTPSPLADIIRATTPCHLR